MTPELTVRMGYSQTMDTDPFDTPETFVRFGKDFACSMGAKWKKVTRTSAHGCDFLLTVTDDGDQYRAGISWLPLTKEFYTGFSWSVPAGSLFCYMDVPTRKHNRILVSGLVEKLLNRLSLPEGLPAPEFYGRNSVLAVLENALPDDLRGAPDVYYIVSRSQGIYSASSSCRLGSPVMGILTECVGAEGWGWYSSRGYLSDHGSFVLGEERARWAGIPTDMGPPDSWREKDKAAIALRRLAPRTEER